MSKIDRNPRAAKRKQRNWQRLATGAGQNLVKVSLPLVNDGETIGLKLGLVGGSYTSLTLDGNGGLMVKTLSGSGLSFGPLGIQLANNSIGSLLTLTTFGTVNDLSVGSDHQVLTADSGSSYGFSWQTPAAVPDFVGNETPSGTVNGVNPTFTFANTIVPDSLLLRVNGIVQDLGGDYTLSVATVTFLTGAIPETGDQIRGSYRK